MSDDLRTDAILAQARVDKGNADARRFVKDLRRAYGFEETGAANVPRKKVLPLPGFIREPISRAFLEQFIADTAAYFFDATKRAAINTTIKAVLRRARGMRDEVMLILKLKWATARPIRSARDVMRFLHPEAAHSLR